MNAAYYTGNKTIEIGESEIIPPAHDEVQIRVAYTGICGTDLHIYEGRMDKRVTIPHVPGHECSGIVTAVGSCAADIAVGDKVVIRPLRYCGKCEGCLSGLSHICYNMNFMGADSNGCLQEYWTVPAHTVYKIPDIPLETAALIEPLAVACHDVSMSNLQFGETALVIGAGPIGLLIALVARLTGANVVISESNDFRVRLASDLGFEVINPHKQDTVKRIFAMTGGYGADVVFEVSGSQQGIDTMISAAKARGRIIQVAIIADPVLINLQRVFLRELRISGARVYEHSDFRKAIALTAAGSVPLERLISQIEPLAELGNVLEMATNDENTETMKILIKCSDTSSDPVIRAEKELLAVHNLHQ